MKTAKELVDQINEAKICAVCLMNEEVDTGEATEVATLEREEHRWYVLATTVFKIGDEFFGVSGPVMLKSEEMTWTDVGVTCKAFLMEAVPSVTYRRKDHAAPENVAGGLDNGETARRVGARSER